MVITEETKLGSELLKQFPQLSKLQKSFKKFIVVLDTSVLRDLERFNASISSGGNVFAAPHINLAASNHSNNNFTYEPTTEGVRQWLREEFPKENSHHIETIIHNMLLEKEWDSNRLRRTILLTLIARTRGINELTSNTYWGDKYVRGDWLNLEYVAEAYKLLPQLSSNDLKLDNFIDRYVTGEIKWLDCLPAEQELRMFKLNRDAFIGFVDDYDKFYLDKKYVATSGENFFENLINLYEKYGASITDILEPYFREVRDSIRFSKCVECFSHIQHDYWVSDNSKFLSLQSLRRLIMLGDKYGWSDKKLITMLFMVVYTGFIVSSGEVLFQEYLYDSILDDSAQLDFLVDMFLTYGDTAPSFENLTEILSSPMINDFSPSILVPLLSNSLTDNENHDWETVAKVRNTIRGILEK